MLLKLLALTLELKGHDMAKRLSWMAAVFCFLFLVLRADILFSFERVDEQCSSYVDECPVPGGVTWQCKKRFMLGTNYAWHHFGADFGGLAAWGLKGVSKNPKIEEEIADMKANGVNVIRWWIMPDLRGDGFLFDHEGFAEGISVGVIEDIEYALELADKYDVYIMLDLFSFDNFKPTRTDYGVTIKSMYPIATDHNRTRALVDKIVRPIASVVENSPYKKRMISWDLINEPEWAMTGPSRYGDPDYECMSGVQCLSHGQMEYFLKSVADGLRAESRALVTVGGAAIKWPKAWSGLNLDFYQYHIYDWVQAWYPYTKTPAQYGVGDKPVVMGEYPLKGLNSVPATDLLSGFKNFGYAGGLGWSQSDPSFGWNSYKHTIKDFAQKYPCETKF